MAKKKSTPSNQIVVNKRARHDYFIEKYFEAGLVLQGWEVKSIRAGKVQLAESHVIIKRGEAWLLNSHITPLMSASTHVRAEPTRTRKLLLHNKELASLIGAVQRQGYTLVPMNLHWTRGRVKCEVGLAKGKKQHDKRAAIKARDWDREKQRRLREKD